MLTLLLAVVEGHYGVPFRGVYLGTTIIDVLILCVIYMLLEDKKKV